MTHFTGCVCSEQNLVALYVDNTVTPIPVDAIQGDQCQPTEELIRKLASNSG